MSLVHTVDESLEHLLQKFSLLNISTNNETNTKERARIIADARNVFKSTIIQFAVQERTLRKKQKEEINQTMKFMATPVRRSTRISNSVYRSTPGVTICSSLHELDNSIKNNIDFRSNNALK